MQAHAQAIGVSPGVDAVVVLIKLIESPFRDHLQASKEQA